ncbi:LacI family transcriptional regulator [Pedobacter yulinensis]|uniref:LacI family transcriptional regulator n=1 Tax=Pedobacter yulinensis TaxID=2126353 RepID=A0A2T3HN44_9SPHI|nr:LacI family DNA-binding transcriptional regulator [Pedobacter yulinensis]PST83846.1 LacI family transcriptional regulator [Pedobacter yulinensis]
MAKIRLKDIAQALGLSVSTVSKALRDSHEIGEDTKRRVLEFAHNHHYFPNRLAKGLKEGRSGTIGVIVCAIDNPFVSGMLEGIDRACQEKGYQIMIMQSKESFLQEQSAIELLLANGIDGLLISPALETTDFSPLLAVQQRGIPVVLFDRISDRIQTHQVGANNFKGAYDATMHLLNKRYKQLAYIHAGTELNFATQRLNGFLTALAERGIPESNYQVAELKINAQTGVPEALARALRKMMRGPARPDAILAGSDQISISCLSILTGMQVKIPQELALIGFSNTRLADVFNPPLSTISQPGEEIGYLAAVRLIGLLTGKAVRQEFETVLMDTQMHIRASSDRLKDLRVSS